MEDESLTPCRNTAAQILKDLKPTMTPEQGKQWLKESREDPDTFFAPDDFWDVG